MASIHIATEVGEIAERISIQATGMDIPFISIFFNRKFLRGVEIYSKND